MKATTCFAALATIGLLALAGCLHDGGDDDSLASDPPVTTETDTSTATLNDSRSANSAEILDATAQAAMSPPQFGSVSFRRQPSMWRARPAFPRPSTAPT